MPENRFVLLTNQVNQNDGFKKTRNAGGDDDEPEVVVAKTPNPTQQSRLRRSNSILFMERRVRRQSRTLEIPATIETVIVKFFKAFNSSLVKQFMKTYGMEAVCLEDFNKTVYFEINDEKKFNVFLGHLRDFFTSDPSVSYEKKPYNLIALIFDFRFLSSRRRVRSYSTISTISLIAAQTKPGAQIYQALLGYLEASRLEVNRSAITPDFLEVVALQQEQVDVIANNFDIVRQITSSRVERRRPGQYGEERRDYGFTVTVPDNVPTVGIIDTGFFRIEPLRPALANIAYDLTSSAPYVDDTGHGTAVASLVVLGEEFIKEIKAEYQAKAKIAVIKVMQSDADGLSIIRLTDTIRQAYREHNVRLFNLSLNDPLPKLYNRHISDYAYALDVLSYELDILIVISVGNIGEQRLNELINDEPHASHEYPRIFYSLDDRSDIHSCESTNISEPSESMNNLSVGALAWNLEDGQTSDITPAKEFPAYYTRKFHYDYEQQVNGSDFMRSQRNKHLNKPDLVFEGGDLMNYNSGMEILRSPIEPNGDRYFSRSAGTSLATPLVTSHLATIMRHYPTLRMQTIKALIINSAKSPCGEDPVMFRGFPMNLLRKLMGFGRPQPHKLISTDDNSATFVIEREIRLEEFLSIPLNLPAFMNGTTNKLNFKMTLCYNFKPIKDNHLAYLPLQITYGLFKTVDQAQMAQMDSEDYQVKSTIRWSDDFFGVENRLFSNTQRTDYSMSGELIADENNRVLIAVKCTGKKEIPETELQHLQNTAHQFSLVVTITELPVSRAHNQLYQELTAINSIQAIAQATGDATLEAGV